MPEEQVRFCMSVLDLGARSFDNDAVYRFFSDKFHFNYQVQTVPWGEWSENDRERINAGTMPDAMLWNFNFSELTEYVRHGRIAPLPEGWENRYPNLCDMVRATGVADKLPVDGKVWAIPRATFRFFAPIRRALSHKSIFYRLDWAEKLGIKIGPSITMEQLADFCRRAISADLAGEGRTLGLATNAANLLYLGLRVVNPAYDTFAKIGGKYAWGPTLEGTTEGIERLRLWYQTGMIDRSFSRDSASDSERKFAAGFAPCLIGDGAISNYSIRAAEYAAAHPGVDPYDCVGITTLVNDQGEWVNKENGNFWTAWVFRPDIDGEVFERILALLDYTCTREGQEIIHMGLPGVDWEYDGKGGYRILRPAQRNGAYADIKTKYESIYLWWLITISSDDFPFVDPCMDKRAKERVAATYEVRRKSERFYAYDPDFEFYTGKAKRGYCVNINNEAIRLILDGKADIKREWNAFIEKNRSAWEPVAWELNNLFPE